MLKRITLSLMLSHLLSYPALASVQLTEAFQFKCSTGQELEFAVHYSGMGGKQSSWGYQSICPRGTLKKAYYSFHPILESLFGEEMPADLASCREKSDSVSQKCKQELLAIVEKPPGTGEFPARSKFKVVGDNSALPTPVQHAVQKYFSCSCETQNTGVREFYNAGGYVCGSQLLKTTATVYAKLPQGELQESDVSQLCKFAKEKFATNEQKRISELGRQFKASSNPCIQSTAVIEVDEGRATPYLCGKLVVEEHEVNERREILKSRVILSSAPAAPAMPVERRTEPRGATK